MKHYALFGEHLGHSLSVPIHEAIFRRLGIRADYRLIELPGEGFEAAARSAMAELDGFNITIPYKQRIMPLLAGLDDRASRVDAVNTVTMPDRTGHNTDVHGFAWMLRRAGIDPIGQPCWVLGTGGASKAVRAALTELGAGRIHLVSRHPGAGEESYAALQERFAGVLIVYLCYGYLEHVQARGFSVRLVAMLGVMAVYLAIYHWARYDFCTWDVYVQKLRTTNAIWYLMHVPAAMLLACYNGERGPRSRAFQMVYKSFYPAHMLILGMLHLFTDL